MVNFPVSLDVFTAIPASTTQDVAIGGRTHRVFHVDEGDAIEALEAKVGTGASTPTANTVLRGTGAGVTAFGQVQTADLVANAITQTGQAVGSTSGPTTTSTSYVDLTDMTVTLTTVGGSLLALLTSTFLHATVNAAIQMGLSLDAAAEVNGMTFQPSTASNQFSITTFALFTGVAAGSHTVKGRWLTNTGTATAVATSRRLVVVELRK